MAEVFLSYSHEDRDIARQLADQLGARGFDVWWDENLRAGDEWRQEITTTLDTVPLVVALWSPSSVRSEWVSLEAGYALVRQKLVPAKIAAVQTPSPFDSIQEADLVDWASGSDRAAIDALASALGQRLAAHAGQRSDAVCETSLASLRRDLRLGGRLILSGLLTGIPLIILTALLWRYVERVAPQGLASLVTPGFIVPAIIQLTLVPVTGVLGWAGWLYLRTAAKTRHRLEFRLGASKEQIFAALTGSSIVSTSPGFIRILCLAFIVGATIAPITVVATILVSLLLGSIRYYWMSIYFFDVVLTLPFFIVSFVSWLRWFSPARWSFLPGPLKWYLLRDTREDFRRRIISMSARLTLEPVELARLKAALDETAGTLLSSTDEELSACFRRLGIVRTLRDVLFGNVLQSTVARVWSVELWKTFERVFPDRSPEDQLQILTSLFPAE